MSSHVRVARRVATGLTLLGLLIPAAAAARSLPTVSKAREVTIYGHRGAAGYRPEHTVGSYTLAARLGADYIEPDLVSTKDHVLVVRHDPEIGETTDVAQHPEFATAGRPRRSTTTRSRAGSRKDFTLAELKTLHAKERIPDIRQHNTLWDGRYKILTFQEFLDLRVKLERQLHRSHRGHPRAQALDLLPLDRPAARGAVRPGARGTTTSPTRAGRVTVQSFEVGQPQAASTSSSRASRSSSCSTPRSRNSPGDVKALGRHADLRPDGDAPGPPADPPWYAEIVSPDKSFIVPRDVGLSARWRPTSFVRGRARRSA